MDIIDNSILTAIFAASLDNADPIEIIKKKSNLSEDYITSRLSTLIKNGLVENNKKSLTELGRTSLKVVLAGGVFDIIHPGHIHTLNAAKKLGDSSHFWF